MKNLHDNEILITSELVKSLIQNQFPWWLDLDLVKINSIGTDNVIYRLGDQLAIRLPMTISAAVNISKELSWLPKLTKAISSPIPEPIALGNPAVNYPYNWLIFKWIPGQNGINAELDLDQAALFLAKFINELHCVDTNNAPLAKRGKPLATMELEVKAALPKLIGVIDADLARLAWDSFLKIPPYQGRPVWVHSDLHTGNILVDHNKRVAAVIDFGMTGIGDPACDMLPAWALLDQSSRIIFRGNLKINDDATWQRGKGWALSFGLVALPYYKDSNPILANVALQTIKQVLQNF